MPEVLTQVDKDDSLKLSGRELDAEIHVRIMGHPLECRLVGDGTSMETALRCEPQNAAWRVRSDADQHWDRWSPTGAERIVIAPHYSEEIAAAMEVVEKMRKAGWCFDIDCYPEDYNVSSYNSGTSEDITEEYLSNIRTRTENYRCQSLAKAICLAALDASGTDAAKLFDLNEANEAFKSTES